MSYRRKTCAYCRDDHSIMDCDKLVTDTRNARNTLEKFETDPEHIKAYIRLTVLRQNYENSINASGVSVYIFRQNVYIGYLCPEQPNFHPWDYYENRLLKPAGIDAELIGSREEQLKFFKEVIDNAQPEISDEEYYSIRRQSMETPRQADRKIAIYEEAMSAKEKRARKACSYCRGEGHTVRTCSKNKEDIITHRKAYKIACYYTARALSRFGLWTGCMTRADNGEIRVANTDRLSTSGNLPSMCIVTGADGLTEDQIDFLYMTKMLSDYIYFKLPNDGSTRHWCDAIRLVTDTSPSAFDEKVDWENNKLIMSGFYSIKSFYPTKIGTKHIYGLLVNGYAPPKKKTTRYDDEEFRHFTGRNVSLPFKREEYKDRTIYPDNLTYYNKKQRVASSWSILQRYVKENEHILNKLTDWIV